MACILLPLAHACRTQPDEPHSRPDPSLSVQTKPTTQTAPAADQGVHHRKPPAGATERAAERSEMVELQLERPSDGRTPIRDERVLEAMQTVPRHLFMPAAVRRYAYADSPVPIGHDQTISQPYIVALMTEALGLKPGERVLEIGTGSGYQAAVLAHLTAEVYTIEIVEPLAEQAKQALHRQGYDEVRCRIGDGYKGWPQAAPFDAIIITCAAPEVPVPLWEQLKAGGRLIMPLGEAGGGQALILLTKRPDGSREEQVISAVRFVPMTRQREAK